MNTSASDNFLFEETIEPQKNEVIFTKKSMYPLIDSNGNSYSGFIVFDGQSAISSTGNWQDLDDITIDIPYVIAMKNTSTASEVDISNYVDAQTLTLKNGLDIIDGIDISAGGQSLTTLYPYSNMFFNFKKMTETSQDEYVKFGNAEFFAKNNSSSFYYNGGSAYSKGDGLSNNSALNDGAVTRQIIPHDTVNGANGLTSLSADACVKLTKSNFRVTGTAQNTVFIWDLMVTLKLKSMSDLFTKLGMSRNLPFRIQINYNSASFDVNIASATTMSMSNPTITTGRTNPVLFIAGDADSNNSTLLAQYAAGPGATTFNKLSIASGVYSANLNGTPHTNAFQQSSAVMWIPTYELKPEIERELIANPKKHFRYIDFYANQLTGLANNGTCNFFVTNSIPNAKFLLVVPIWTAGTTNTGMTTNTQSPITSCFDTCPSTTSPLTALTNIQVFVGNQGLFSTQIQYDNKTYLQEMSKINCLNGGRSALTSGLLSYVDWSYMYRYYAFDLSRVTNDGMPKSLVFNAQNISGKILDLYCFIAYEKSGTLDLVAGNITDLKV